MPETLFCHSCRVHHPRERMCRYLTRQGFRWRCRSTLEASSASIDERDAFGRGQTEVNRRSAKELAERLSQSADQRRSVA